MIQVFEQAAEHDRKCEETCKEQSLLFHSHAASSLTVGTDGNPEESQTTLSKREPLTKDQGLSQCFNWIQLSGSDSRGSRGSTDPPVFWSGGHTIMCDPPLVVMPVWLSVETGALLSTCFHNLKLE
jgi:hypothetical protein